MKKLALFLSIFFLFGIMIHANAQPANSAQSAIVFNCNDNKIVYEKNAYTKRPIASVTKIMSVIIAIEDGKLNSRVVISKEAANQPPTSAGLNEGDILTLEQLLYAMMMRSGNDAAYAVAEHIGGNVNNFVKLMNQKAKALGLKNTTYHSPSGLPQPEENISTAYDLARLMCYAMENPTFREIVKQPSYSTTSLNGIPFTWENEDKLVRENDWIIGGKTGFTKAAGRTLVNAAEKNGVRLVTVTLNDANDWEDQLNLFKYGFKQYGIEV